MNNNQKKRYQPKQPSVSTAKAETKLVQLIIARIGQLLHFRTNNQKNKRESKHSFRYCTESKKTTIPPWLMIVGQKSLLMAIVGGSVTVTVTFITNPDKVQLWLTMLSPKLVSFSCEGVTVQIPQNWALLGCQTSAIPDYPDAIIIPKTYVVNESKSPKLCLIVDELYDNNVTLKTFYQKESDKARLFIANRKSSSFRGNGEFQFKGSSANYELVYHADNIKRRDLGFLYRKKQYKVRFEASLRDFDKYEQESRKILSSLEFR